MGPRRELERVRSSEGRVAGPRSSTRYVQLESFRLVNLSCRSGPVADRLGFILLGEQDDLMTLTLTHAPHSPLRHAATARLNASKLRRSSLPPSMGQAIPSLLKDALSDVSLPPALSLSISRFLTRQDLILFLLFLAGPSIPPSAVRHPPSRLVLNLRTRRPPSSRHPRRAPLRRPPHVHERRRRRRRRRPTRRVRPLPQTQTPARQANIRHVGRLVRSRLHRHRHQLAEQTRRLPWRAQPNGHRLRLLLHLRRTRPPL